MPILRSSTGTTSSTRRVSVLYRRTAAQHNRGTRRDVPLRQVGSGRRLAGGSVARGPRPVSVAVLGARSHAHRLPALLSVPGQDPDGDLDGLTLAELGHEGLDLVADELLPLHERVANALDRVPLLEEQFLDPISAIVGGIAAAEMRLLPMPNTPT